MMDEKNKETEGIRDPELPEEFQRARSVFYYEGNRLDLAVYSGNPSRDLSLDRFLEAFTYLVKTVRPLDDIDPLDQRDLNDLERFLREYIPTYYRDPNKGHNRILEAYFYFSRILEKYGLNFKHIRKLKI